MLPGVKPECKLVNEELDRHFARRSSQLSPELQRHLDECESCRALFMYLGDRASADICPDEVEHQIVQRLQGSLKPVKRLRSPTAITAQLVMVFVLIAAA